jgi:hypothetical protein
MINLHGLFKKISPRLTKIKGIGLVKIEANQILIKYTIIILF